MTRKRLKRLIWDDMAGLYIDLGVVIMADEQLIAFTYDVSRRYARTVLRGMHRAGVLSRCPGCGGYYLPEQTLVTLRRASSAISGSKRIN